ncbi:MAG: ATP-binding protein [bacterium]|nr:ATP-binding protein [bacterium]
MQDLSLHILDVVENSVAASAETIEISIVESTASDLLRLEIRDDGKGMDDEMRRKALDPFFTTRTTRRIGLGLPLLAQAARESGGSLELESAPGKGTTVRAEFQLSHPDRKPLGDMAATLGAILAGRPELDLRFEYERDGETVACLDSRQPAATGPE